MTVLENSASIAPGASVTTGAFAPGANGVAIVLKQVSGSPINGVNVGVQYSLDATLYTDTVPLVVNNSTVRTTPNSSGVSTVFANIPTNSGVVDIKIVLTNTDTAQAAVVILQATAY